MRFIDADELTKKLEEEVFNLEKNSTFISTYMHSALLWVISVINRAPTIDAEPVRHGEWTDTGIEELDLIYSGYKCSQCGFILCGDHTKYCPGCGSKMDKKSPENHKKYQEEETNKKSFK